MTLLDVLLVRDGALAVALCRHDRVDLVQVANEEGWVTPTGMEEKGVGGGSCWV